MAIEFKLPELGEGIESGDVLTLLVKEGDVLRAHQAIMELETDKATVEVPSPHAGKIIKLHVAEGQTLKIGAPILTIEPETAASGESPPPIAPATSTTTAAPVTAQSPATPPTSTPEPAAVAAVSRGPTSPSPQVPVAQPSQAAWPAPPAPAGTITTAPASSPTTTSDEDANVSVIAPAGPATRRFARELGVDLKHVRGTGPAGRITREDVIHVVRTLGSSSPQPSIANPQSPAPSPQSQIPSPQPPTLAPGEPDADAWGPIRREVASRVRRTIAAKMHESWSTIPRVTNFDDADITELEQHREESKEDYARTGIKLTTMPFLMKAVAICLKKHPLVNATYDDEHGVIVYKDYVNLGIAVDTDRGLVVPVIRHADRLTIPELARQLAEVVQAARANTFKLEDLRGGTFSISNLGSVGGTYSTPIINFPEVAILLAGRARKLPVVLQDEVAIRLMLPLSLSYDHRLVDGATAARFLNDVIGYLQSPTRLLLAP